MSKDISWLYDSKEHDTCSFSTFVQGEMGRYLISSKLEKKKVSQQNNLRLQLIL